MPAKFYRLVFDGLPTRRFISGSRAIVSICRRLAPSSISWASIAAPVIPVAADQDADVVEGAVEAGEGAGGYVWHQFLKVGNSLGFTARRHTANAPRAAGDAKSTAIVHS